MAGYIHLIVRRGVTVSMSVFLACHQCYCVGSSLTRGLNIRALVYMWYFLKLVARGFLLRVRVGDSLRCSEETVKNLEMRLGMR